MRQYEKDRLREAILQDPYLINLQKLDPKEESLIKFQEIIDFVIKYGEKPSERSKDVEEKRLGKRLGDIRAAKRGTRNRKFHPEHEEMIKDHSNALVKGLLALVNPKEIALGKFQEIIDFVVKRGKKPLEKSKDVEAINSLKPARDEVASYRRNQSRGSKVSTPRQSSFNGILVFVFILMTILMGIGGYALYEVQTKLHSSNLLLGKGQEQVIELERRLSATG